MPGIKTLAMGGEPIRSAEIARWKQTETVIGIYGPAECAQALSIVPLTPSTRNGHVGSSLGARTWLVVPGYSDRLAAIGSIGELMIEGPTVAKEYFEAQDKTDGAFIRDPAWLLRGGAPGYPGRRGRLYKTGDLLRQNSDGTLDFIGRKDGLIKLRGQRVELTEVEFHVTRLLPGGTSAAAEIIIPIGTESPLLAVFLVVQRDQLGGMIAGVEERLSEVVPRYMIPNAWIPVDTIPMTTTSKTDRRALREMGSKYTLESIAGLQSAGTFNRPPESDMEKRMAGIWSGVLGIDISSINCASNFMRIGGESIAAMKLVAAAQRQHIAITVADVFLHPQLEDLALAARELVGTSGEERVRHQPFSLIVDQRDRDEFLGRVQNLLPDGGIHEMVDVLPATDFQQQAIHDALQDPPSRWPHWIMDLPSNVDFDRLQHACTELVRYFSILHTVFVHIDDRYWQVVLDKLSPPFDLIESTGQSSTEATKSACEEDLQRPRSLGVSFIRFIAIKDYSSQHKLIFRLSHAQFDGFSFSSVLHTLSQLYANETLPSPPSFADVVSFNSSKKRESLEYWSSRLHNSKPPTWWNTSSTSPSKTTYTIDDRIVLSQTAPLPTIDQCEGVSPATIFHAACALVLSRHFGQSEILMGRLVTGRSMLPSDLQNVIGPLLTEVPIRYTLRQDAPLHQIAREMQSQFIEDSKYEAVGMVEIIERATDWKGVVDFGWRTAFQQEEEEEGEGGGAFTFLNSPSRVSFYDRPVLPRPRPEIYATPRGGVLELRFEGNLQLISKDMAGDVLGELRDVLIGFCGAG